MRPVQGEYTPEAGPERRGTSHFAESCVTEGSICAETAPRRTLKQMLVSMENGIALGLGATAGLGLAVGGYAYAAMWPASRIFGSSLIAPRRPDEMALTFDDGPNPQWTPRLLETLAQFHAPATFFVVGRYAEQNPELVRHMLDAGHTLGVHSWSHLNLAVTSKARIREELTRGKETLEAITGQPVRLFRPPFGARRPAALRMARQMGLTPVLWNAMTSDWALPEAEQIAANLTKKIDQLTRRGWAANVVLHDGNHLDAEAHREPSVTAAGMLLAHYAETKKFVSLEAWERS